MTHNTEGAPYIWFVYSTTGDLPGGDHLFRQHRGKYQPYSYKVQEIKRRNCTLTFFLQSHMENSQQNSYSISHLLDIVTTRWLDSDSEGTVDNCRQHCDYTPIGSLVAVLPAVINGDYAVTLQSPCSHCV